MKNIIRFNVLIGILQAIMMIWFAIHIYNVPDGEMGLVLLFFMSIFLFLLFILILVWSIRLYRKYMKGNTLESQSKIVFAFWIVTILMEILFVLSTIR
jgi:hypothetical protein